MVDEGVSDAASSLLPYPVDVAAGAVETLGARVADVAPAHRYAIVSDAQVAPLSA